MKFILPEGYYLGKEVSFQESTGIIYYSVINSCVDGVELWNSSISSQGINLRGTLNSGVMSLSIPRGVNSFEELCTIAEAGTKLTLTLVSQPSEFTSMLELIGDEPRRLAQLCNSIMVSGRVNPIPIYLRMAKTTFTCSNTCRDNLKLLHQKYGEKTYLLRHVTTYTGLIDGTLSDVTYSSGPNPIFESLFHNLQRIDVKTPQALYVCYIYGDKLKRIVIDVTFNDCRDVKVFMNTCYKLENGETIRVSTLLAIFKSRGIRVTLKLHSSELAYTKLLHKKINDVLFTDTYPAGELQLPLIDLKDTPIEKFSVMADEITEVDYVIKKL